MQRFACTLWMILFIATGSAQYADFSIPDTICQGKPVFITNVQPSAANSWQWSFCSGNANYQPEGIILGNPLQILNSPYFVTLVSDSSGYYSFITSNGNGLLVRCFFGKSLDHHPITITNLGNYGTQLRGIQVKKDQGNWYGFIANGASLVKLSFGEFLSSDNPSVQSINLTGVNTVSGLIITKQDSEWIGLGTDMGSHSLFRLDFGSTLENDPQVDILGNFGQLKFPSSLAVAVENKIWYALVSNMGNNTISRFNFGTSLTNSPTADILSGIFGLNDNAGIALIPDCGRIGGLVTNFVNHDIYMIHLAFNEGLSGNATPTSIGNIGILNYPYGISEFVRIGDTLYGFVANYGSSEITRIFFPVCYSASQPSYSGRNPPEIIYSSPGNYNILLTVDAGTPTQSMQCKNIIVMPKPPVSLGPDRDICENTSTVLDAGPGDSIYNWSTGDHTQTITVDTSGTYWIHAINYWNCEGYDTITITLHKNSYVTVDTTICQGLSYWAQHELRYTSGVYYDTLVSANSCDSIITTNLSVKECPLMIWFPSAFTPNDDGLNDVFMPVCKSITHYNLQIYDRWGQLIFESNDVSSGWNGSLKDKMADPGVFSYIAIFESEQYPGETQKIHGTFTLVR